MIFTTLALSALLASPGLIIEPQTHTHPATPYTAAQAPQEASEQYISVWQCDGGLQTDPVRPNDPAIHVEFTYGGFYRPGMQAICQEIR